MKYLDTLGSIQQRNCGPGKNNVISLIRVCSTLGLHQLLIAIAIKEFEGGEGGMRLTPADNLIDGDMVDL